MSNMSYCRWENTAADMADCVEAMRAFNETHEDFVGHESDEPTKTSYEDLSRSERQGYFDALACALEMLENADPDHLDEAGVNFNRR